MGRPPFPVPTPPATPSQPGATQPGATQSGATQSGASQAGASQASAMMPGLAPTPTRSITGASRPARDPDERRTLVVGRGISVQGTVQDAERLVVEGTVEATMIHATELSIAPSGVFKGEVEVEDAEIAGTIDGTLTARGSLMIRSTGRVLGVARCRRLQVEDGGEITGRMEMIAGEGRPAPAATAVPEVTG